MNARYRLLSLFLVLTLATCAWCGSFTSKASGLWAAEGQTTWNEAGHPGAADSVTINTGHAITTDAAWACTTLDINGTGSLITAHAGTATVIQVAASGGSTAVLTTGAGALSCTSINCAVGGAAGNCTIGAGGATLAGILLNGATNTMTINGAVTGVTTFTPANCAMNANVACTSFVTAAGCTFTMANSTQLTGFTGACTMNGAWVVGNGCTVSANANSTIVITGTTGASLTVTGTTGAHTTFTNANAGASAKLALTDIETITLTYADFRKGGPCLRANTVGWRRLLATNCDFEAASDYCVRAGTASNVDLVSCFLSNGTYGLGLTGQTSLTNCVFGKDVDGNTQANTTADIYFVGIAGTIRGYSVACYSTTPITFGATSAGAWGSFDNWGYAGTDAQRASLVQGVGYYWNGKTGSVERSTANPYTGQTYHARSTPASTVTATLPLDYSIYYSIQSGQNISTTVYASRHILTSTSCASIIIDPEQAWFTSVTSTQTLDDADTYTKLTATTTGGAGGTQAKGMVRIVFRTNSYNAGGYTDWSNATIQVK